MSIREGHQVYVASLPDCDLCKRAGEKSEARYDGATTFGPWAYMCESCFMKYGLGTGVGRGQELLVREATP